MSSRYDERKVYILKFEPTSKTPQIIRLILQATPPSIQAAQFLFTTSLSPITLNKTDIIILP